MAFVEHGFKANAIIDTEIEPFVSFYEALALLNRELRGVAALKTYRDDLTLEARVSNRGRVFWGGTVGLGFSGGSRGAKVEFWIDDDQTSLAIILDQLNAMIEDAKSEER